jgi:hypothetical protein
MEWKSVLALVTVAVTCLVAPAAFAATADTVIATHDSSSYTIAYYENANMGFPDAQLHVVNPGSTGGFGSGYPNSIAYGDLCANVYVFTPDQQLAECCSCKVSPNGMQGFSLATDLATNPLTSTTQHAGAIKIVSSTGGGPYSAGLPPVSVEGNSIPFCDPATNYYPNGTLQAWITHVRPLGASLGAAFTVTEINFEPVDLSYSELMKLQEECFAIEAPAGKGGVGSTAGICNCDPNKAY